MATHSQENVPRRVAIELDAAQRLASVLGLDGRLGPSPDYEGVEPTPEADALAEVLANDALPALRSGFANPHLRPEITVRDAPVDGTSRVFTVHAKPTPPSVPEAVDAIALGLGLPLLMSVCPELTPAIRDLQVKKVGASADPASVRRALGVEPALLRQDRALRQRFARELVVQETDLWTLAGEHGAKAATLPYATRIRALRWWCHASHGRDPQPSLCIRCGHMYGARASTSNRNENGLPFCSFCRKRKALKKGNAIAPADRGTWWVRCQRCSEPFLTPRPNALYCQKHQTRNLHHSKR